MASIALKVADHYVTTVSAAKHFSSLINQSLTLINHLSPTRQLLEYRYLYIQIVTVITKAGSLYLHTAEYCKITYALVCYLLSESYYLINLQIKF